MAFEYKNFLTSSILSAVRTELVHNSVSTEDFYLRMLHIHNSSDVTAVTIEVWLVANVGGAEGNPGTTSRVYKKTLAAGESDTKEFPIPGIVMDYNDKLEFRASVADIALVTLSGGRNYNA